MKKIISGVIKSEMKKFKYLMSKIKYIKISCCLLLFLGIFLAIVGTVLNTLVSYSNDNKMPVLEHYFFSNSYYERVSHDFKHFGYKDYENIKFKVLADNHLLVLDLNKRNYWLFQFSVGDIILILGLFVLVMSLLFIMGNLTREIIKRYKNQKLK